MSNRKHVDCITKVRQQMKKDDPSLGWVKFILAGTNGVTGQAIQYSETVTKRDGTKKEVIKKSYVTHDFCPFCGEKFVFSKQSEI